ncbi:MAG TPA: beta-N-acetylhexosaminidase, partial [Anseongella sp.]|nr:beta-N-acetylhexosaminidase [Anseongella sp.]
MRRLLLLLTILFLSRTAGASDCPVIPLPAACRLGAGEFRLNERTAIIPEDPGLYDAARGLQGLLLEKTGHALPIRYDKAAGQTSISIRRDAALGDEEAYRLSISPQQIIIEGKEEAGFFYGNISLLQLLQYYARDARGKVNRLKGREFHGQPEGTGNSRKQPGKLQMAGMEAQANAGRPGNKVELTIPCWQIEDGPAYPWRGIMLDEARHFFGKEKVKQLLDLMARYKLNRFHWHLTDVQGWRIEIKGYPELALTGGIGNRSDPEAPAKYYTQEEISEIIAYARERQIEVIPEIDMPGHAGAANRAYPEYAAKHPPGRSAFTFNPGLESTYQYLSDILKETDALFPFQMIHLGGDEVAMGTGLWSEDPAILSLMREKQLDSLSDVEHYFIERMADTVLSLGNQVLAWEEAANAGLPADETV